MTEQRFVFSGELILVPHANMLYVMKADVQVLEQKDQPDGDSRGNKHQFDISFLIQCDTRCSLSS